MTGKFNETENRQTEWEAHFCANECEKEMFALEENLKNDPTTQFDFSREIVQNLWKAGERRFFISVGDKNNR